MADRDRDRDTADADADRAKGLGRGFEVVMSCYLILVSAFRVSCSSISI